MDGSGNPVGRAGAARPRHSGIINPPELSAAIRDTVASLQRRDAEAHARGKAELAALRQAAAERAKPPPRLAPGYQPFAAWCRGVLEAKVRFADAQLRKARTALTQTLGAPRAMEPGCPPATVAGETVLTLARDREARTLIVSLHADGTVRARESGGKDRAEGAYAEVKVEALDAYYAEDLLIGFLAGVRAT